MNPLDYLRARLDEEEAQARRAIAEPDDDGVWSDERPYEHSAMVTGAGITIYDEGGHSPQQAWHIAYWDPARVLAEIAAKRQIICLYQEAMAADQNRMEGYEIHENEGERSIIHHVVIALVQVYADRDDFDPAWRPTP